MTDHGHLYEQAGVDYDVLDAAKRDALGQAALTSALATARGATLLDASRGEPATVLEIGGRYLAFVLECLGTKSMIAASYEKLTGVDRFSSIAYDTVGAIVNDCCCVGALPFVVNAYFATGSAQWYGATRHRSLVEGWRRACEDAGAAWGGGESPTLSGLIAPDGIDLAGSAIGLVPEGRQPILGEELGPGDEIVLVASSGLHANGASLVRSAADQLPEGLSTTLASGSTLGEAALQESVLYVSLIEALAASEIALHYASHITGHGWRKLMRADRELSYRLVQLPEVPEVLAFLVEHFSMSPSEAYATFNMGAGFALYVAQGQGEATVELARALGHRALVAGRVETGPREVVIEPLGVHYGAEDLELRS
jgi:phosphoribosylformylglycinamidine cyclo-ligase